MEKIVVYWSMTGNTESIALEIAKNTDAKIKYYEETTISEVSNYDVIILGCPAMGDEELEDGFKEFNDELLNSLKDKTIFLFGSYGWGNGLFMEKWEEQVSSSSNKLGSKGLIAMGDFSCVSKEEFNLFISEINKK